VNYRRQYRGMGDESTSGVSGECVPAESRIAFDLRGFLANIADGGVNHRRQDRGMGGESTSGVSGECVPAESTGASMHLRGSALLLICVAWVVIFA